MMQSPLHFIWEEELPTALCWALTSNIWADVLTSVIHGNQFFQHGMAVGMFLNSVYYYKWGVHTSLLTCYNVYVWSSETAKVIN